MFCRQRILGRGGLGRALRPFFGFSLGVWVLGIFGDLGFQVLFTQSGEAFALK